MVGKEHFIINFGKEKCILYEKNSHFPYDIINMQKETKKRLIFVFSGDQYIA